MAGMVFFGFLADRYGRKAVYGAELVIVIVATIGMTEATAGYGSPGYMNIYGWIGFWRVLLGLGLGAEVSTSLHSGLVDYLSSDIFAGGRTVPLLSGDMY